VRRGRDCEQGEAFRLIVRGQPNRSVVKEAGELAELIESSDPIVSEKALEVARSFCLLRGGEEVYEGWVWIRWFGCQVICAGPADDR
jgi:hypothetical protein